MKFIPQSRERGMPKAVKAASLSYREEIRTSSGL